MRRFVSGTKHICGARAGELTHRGEKGVQRRNKRPARRIGGARTSNRDRSGRGLCGQGNTHCGVNQRRERAAADSRAAHA